MNGAIWPMAVTLTGISEPIQSEGVRYITPKKTMSGALRTGQSHTLETC